MPRTSKGAATVIYISSVIISSPSSDKFETNVSERPSGSENIPLLFILIKKSVLSQSVTSPETRLKSLNRVKNVELFK